jgi:hypothetical protein
MASEWNSLFTKLPGSSWGFWYAAPQFNSFINRVVVFPRTMEIGKPLLIFGINAHIKPRIISVFLFTPFNLWND